MLTVRYVIVIRKMGPIRMETTNARFRTSKLTSVAEHSDNSSSGLIVRQHFTRDVLLITVLNLSDSFLFLVSKRNKLLGNVAIVSTTLV